MTNPALSSALRSGLPRIGRATMAMLVFATASATQAATVTATLHQVSPGGQGAVVGTVEFKDSPEGAIVSARLAGLPPGLHGFHIHENGSCDAAADRTGKLTAAGAAGGHLDPDKTGAHHGPEGQGHVGDLPKLTVSGDGTAVETLVAPRMRDVTLLKGRTLMIHAGGDNYSDDPVPLGGGGARIACGAIQ